jgi:hypothetical protein
MGMTEEEIKAAREKLGIDNVERGKKHKTILCQANQCSKPATQHCKYCNMWFCNYHSEPVIATTAKYVWSLDRSDYEKYKKYNEDWQRKDGHPDVKYTETWNADNERKRVERYRNVNKAYDTIFSKGRDKKYHQQKSNYYSDSPRTSSYGTYSKSSARSGSFLSILYDKWLLKDTLILSIILAIIATLPIGIIITSGLTLNTSLFTSTNFLIDFVVIFIIFVVYRKFAAHTMSYWAGTIISILSSVFLLSIINFSNITNLLNFLEVLLSLFIAGYVGNLAGKALDSGTYNYKRKALIYTGRGIVIVFVIIIVAGLSLHISSFLKTNSSIGGSNQNLVNSSLNDIGKISNTISSALSSPQINGTWAAAFFDNVSIKRGEPYTYCANLTKFAGTRFNTMAQNYGISHYGYSEDFNKTWPNGVQVGDAIYYGFGEEVFYPSGYNASNYVQQIITTAPLHWQELEDRNLTTYGYYIANGPSYEILGPNGGYTACPVTEIPGPDVNISQYFAQYGCSVETANLTYFVIEIASFCPYGG